MKQFKNFKIRNAQIHKRVGAILSDSPRSESKEVNFNDLCRQQYIANCTINIIFVVLRLGGEKIQPTEYQSFDNGKTKAGFFEPFFNHANYRQ